ncbi:START domain-containing protein 10-like isoform X3 [Pantherophis guttatus]|uniref:START domain-containing protein 10 n=1 Tax=Pantherophis guttatus TaxID=94885 RepID=A0A6P9D5E9_PANGU|nr:START domain-containing protein 10-like isoform X3 [Pantherophis guttatus]
MEPVRLPDEAAFRAFQAECETELGWLSRYNRDGIAVWGQLPPQGDVAVHRVKGRVNMPDVSAETVFDVLHDTEYRKKWDLNVIETHEIARLSDNADVGYYSWKCPKPLKNRDVVTLRSWRVLDKSYVILNFSVKHQKYPPRKDLVRAVSLLAGYLVQPTGPNSCCLTYLAQVDPKGSLPKWVVNKASQYLAPKSPAARSTGDQVLQLLIQNPPFFLKICKLATFASWRFSV